MGREIRRVPANWKHPKYIREDWKTNLPIADYKPLFNLNYQEAIKDYEEELPKWLEAQKKWDEGIYVSYKGTEIPKKEAFKEWLESIEERRKEYNFSQSYCAVEKERYKTGYCTYSDVNGDLPCYPNPEDYMPTGEWYQLFETVSEGTPLSPPFEKPEELVEWLTNNKDYWGTQWSREGAEGIVKNGYALSGIMVGGKMYPPEEQYLLKDSTPPAKAERK